MAYTKLGDHAGMSVTESGYWIRTYHPFDLAEYHWAHSADGARWEIYRGDGMRYNHRRTHAGTVTTADPNVVVDQLRKYDAAVYPMMDLS